MNTTHGYVTPIGPGAYQVQEIGGPTTYVYEY
jgi:hypothetical protein